jgi:hypothetical protein
MKRHLVIFYTVIIVLIISGRYAWQHCEWDWISRVAAIAVIVGILIEGWELLAAKKSDSPAFTLSDRTLTSARMVVIILCLGTFVAGFGELIGKWAFGCAG